MDLDRLKFYWKIQKISQNIGKPKPKEASFLEENRCNKVEVNSK